MDLQQIAQATAKTLMSYLTYQAVRTVLHQLSETDPPRAFWLNDFTSRNSIQDAEQYLRDLLRERQDLAFRIMTVRTYLAEEVADFLPEMVKTGIEQANMEHRRQYLERITGLSSLDPAQPEHPPAPDEPPST
ncbi:RuBisCO chaperone RbcX [Anthocerotibacter panamensis]|uniref:RuBisCO chaperone RbcX n=1 Tax=Anthocerotibacter panamensis TaxID=2857077 RepID=UPI001C4074D0